MKLGRVSPAMIVAILVMFGAWIGLGFVLRTGQSSWAVSAFFFISIARMLLLGALVVGLAAAGIACCMKPNPATEEKRTTGAGAIAALIIAALAVLVAGCGVYDAAYGRGGSGEWSGLGELFVYAVSIPGGIAALVMAACLKSMRSALRLPCIVLALLALGLPFAVSPLRKARDKRRYEEIMNSDTTRKMIEEAKGNKRSSE